MKLPATNKTQALDVDFDPMPLAGAVEEPSCQRMTASSRDTCSTVPDSPDNHRWGGVTPVDKPVHNLWAA
jgi:hypothetical protein